MESQKQTLITGGGGMTNEAPEKIYNWQHTQLSIASIYGGIRYNGHEYRIAYDQDGQPLVRVDKKKRKKKGVAE